LLQVRFDVGVPWADMHWPPDVHVAHGVQLVAPAAENELGPHAVHVLAFWVPEYVPALQAVHV
jgi:hypothetical protein